MLDRDFPHLLREWTAADGSHMKMKRSLKVDYWKYARPGDASALLNESRCSARQISADEERTSDERDANES